MVAGPSGLSMLKQLREDGFAVTLFERRNKVGGLWAYSEDKRYTTALPRVFIHVLSCIYFLSLHDDERPEQTLASSLAASATTLCQIVSISTRSI